MIEVGQYNELRILRVTSVGLFLGDESGEDVLLPNKYCPEEFEIGDRLNVFVYRDYEERKIATNIHPKILLYDFALLQVKDVSGVGAFLDWGLEKELMVPFSEQRQKMQVNRWYIVYLDLDKETDRLFASNRLDRYLQNENLTVAEEDEVNLMVYRQSELGYSVIVNGLHKGLIYENEVFRKLDVGDKLKGFVKKVRAENKLDISLQPIGFEKYNDANTQTIYDALMDANGFLNLSDKSDPMEIYRRLKMSKKAFKKSVGSLYKQKRITIGNDGIRLT